MEKSIAMNKTNKGNMLFSLSMTVEDIIKRSTKSWLLRILLKEAPSHDYEYQISKPRV